MKIHAIRIDGFSNIIIRTTANPYWFQGRKMTVSDYFVVFSDLSVM